LAPARICKLLPGFCHLLKLLAVSRRRSSRHVSAFSGVLLILVDLLHDETVSSLRKIFIPRPAQKTGGFVPETGGYH
jgi:hypothetical protein